MHEEYPNIALHLNWNVGILEQWPPARRSYGSERIMGDETA